MVPLAEGEVVAGLGGQPVAGVPERPLPPDLVMLGEPDGRLPAKVPAQMLPPGEELGPRARAPPEEELERPIGLGGEPRGAGALGEGIEQPVEFRVVPGVRAGQGPVMRPDAGNLGQLPRLRQPHRPAVEGGGEERRMLRAAGVTSPLDHRLGVGPRPGGQVIRSDRPRFAVRARQGRHRQDRDQGEPLDERLASAAGAHDGRRPPAGAATPPPKKGLLMTRSFVARNRLRGRRPASKKTT